MKKFFKEMIPAFILVFVASFMLFIYEPIFTYASNINDFWFDFQLMLPNIIICFFSLMFILLVIYSFLYWISILTTKKTYLFKSLLIISFVLYIVTYIQGNFLIGNLPTLNGTTINWNSYNVDNIISVSIMLILILLEIVLIKKLKIEKTIKINKYITIVTFLMLSTSLISSLLKPMTFKEKVITMATNRNINNVSIDKNYYIFVTDSVDSKDFYDVTQESNENQKTFKDFTYYPDTVGAYLYTRDAVPFILSGIWNENEKEFVDYYNDAFNQSKLLNKLVEKKYNMNFYEDQIYLTSRKASQFSNLEIYNDKINRISFVKQWIKYDLYKYLPFYLKKYSKIETADFDLCKIDEQGSYYMWDNDIIYEILNNSDINKINEKNFQFIHIEGGHVPFNYDENVNKISESNGTYKQKLRATLKIIETFINRLKENEAYDNSVIVVLADHGEGPNGRQNPILFIKGVEENHDKMQISNLPLSYEDLQEAFLQLLDGDKSGMLFKNIDLNRTRRFINNLYTEERMIEYEQHGNAGDRTLYEKTGREFNR